MTDIYSAPGNFFVPLFAAITLVFLAFLPSGCAGGHYIGPPITAGATFTFADGESVGGSIRLDPSFARQKK